MSYNGKYTGKYDGDYYGKIAVGAMGGWTPAQLVAVHRHIAQVDDEDEQVFRCRILAIAAAMIAADEEFWAQ